MPTTASRPQVPGLSRRAFLKTLTALGASAWLAPGSAEPAADTFLTRPIPATGEAMPVIGMGTWITFNVGFNESARAERVEILRTFFDRGGAMVDSSPMYGSSEAVVGHCLAQLGGPGPVFSATKVWTPFQGMGVDQMEESQELWGVNRFDLLQVHNLLNWDGHLETLKAWKAQGKVRYIGITTSHGRRHDEMEKLMKTQPLDFVQFTYNVLDREAEGRLLPLAADRGLAVIINRPFRRGALFDYFQQHSLPAWVSEFDCRNWAQFFLKFIVSHPAVTCAIPATSQLMHMQENMGACYGRLPDARMRRRMVRFIESL